MELKFECPKCGQHLSATRAQIGMTVPCPNCNVPVGIPIESTLPPRVSALPQPQELTQNPQGGVINRIKFRMTKLVTMVVILLVMIGAWLAYNSSKHRTTAQIGPQRDFSDLQRKDWYEDLKRQQTLKNEADFKLQWIAQRKIDPRYSAELREILAKEQAAHKANYEGLSSIASKILAAKEYPEYQKLKAQEDEVLAAIEVQKLGDKNDVLRLRLKVGEFEAERLEIEQRYQ
jgi:hypothetical protein